ncbi:MAG: porin [Chitinophagaceae bacterium]
MLRKFLLATFATLLLITLKAQDSTKTLTISGNADAYYRYNFAGQGGEVRNFNNFTSFTNSQSSFELGMASIRADATALSGKVGATVDLGFGRRADEFSYNDGEDGIGNGFISLSNIKQAYITYAPSSKVKFTVGKFATHVGYELLDAPLNRNYSMSYMFTNGPFFHTGVKADITAGPVGFMLGVTNFTDESTSTTSVKNLIAQFSGGVPSGKFKWYLNYSGFFGSDQGNNPSGLESLHQVDLVLLATISSKFNIGYNGTMQSRQQITGSTDPEGSWFGNAVYLNFDPTDKVGLTLRSEYISDSKEVLFGTNILANTLSLNWKLGPLTIVPELRYESAKDEFYADKDSDPSKSTFSALVAALFKF